MVSPLQLSETIQQTYMYNLHSIHLHWKRGWISNDEMCARRYMNRKWYNEMLYLVEPPSEVPVADLFSDVIAKYDTDHDNFPLTSIIYYHGEEIPVYNDDYGQQVFAKWKDREWSGGAYNLMYKSDFCRMINSALEAEIWDQWEKEYDEEN